MLPETPRPTVVRLTLPILALCALAAGCQTSDGGDPNSNATVDGDFQQLAACYARSQNTVAARPAAGSDGARAVSVTTLAAAPAADALSSSNSKSAEEAVQGAGATSYRVTFRELPTNQTRVSGTSLGAATRPFTWFETVLPALRNCTGNTALR